MTPTRWGRFHTGTLVWHALDDDDRRKTLCGRTFARGPWTSENVAPPDDKCFRCAQLVATEKREQRKAMVAGEAKPKAMQAGGSK